MAPNDSTFDVGRADAIFQKNGIGDDVSSFVLACIKQLNDCYPRPLDTALLAQKFDVSPTGERVLGLFRESGFIAGSETHSILTLRGQRSIRLASNAEGKVAQFFSGNAADDPNDVLIALWRTHYYAWEGTTFGGL